MLRLLSMLSLLSFHSGQFFYGLKCAFELNCGSVYHKSPEMFNLTPKFYVNIIKYRQFSWLGGNNLLFSILVNQYIFSTKQKMMDSLCACVKAEGELSYRVFLKKTGFGLDSTLVYNHLYMVIHWIFSWKISQEPHGITQ